MFMLVPLNGDNTQESTITSLDGRKAMAKLELEDNAEVIDITFITDIDDALNSGIDYLIVDSFEQDIDNYLDYNVEVLQCMPNSDIDDVLEGFIFRTLREMH